MSGVHTGRRRRTWFALFLGVLAFSTLRGIRFPNIWSYSHFLFNYDYGFTKRGLLGAVVQAAGSSRLLTYDVFFVLSVVVFITNFILLAMLGHDLIRRGGRLGFVCSLLFASSMAVVFLAHTVGYSDHLGLLVTLLALRVNGFYRRAVLLAIALPLLLMIHEAMLIVFFPVMFLSMLFPASGGHDAEVSRGRRVAVLGGLSVVALASLYLTAAPLGSTEVELMFQDAQAAVDHPLRRDAFAVLERPASANIEYVARLRDTPGYRQRMRRSLAATAPTTLVFVLLTVVLLRAAGRKAWIVGLSVGASVPGLALHTIGADLHRWNTLVVTTSFLVLYLASRAVAATVDFRDYDRLALVAVPLVLANLLTSIELFDGYAVKTVPFSEHLDYLKSVAEGESRFPYVPPR